MHCLAKCLHVSTHNVYTLRDLYFTPADQCHFTVRFDDLSCYLWLRNVTFTACFCRICHRLTFIFDFVCAVEFFFILF